MSAMRCQVVFADRSAPGSEACGIENPQPRWSNSTMRYFAGSNRRRWVGVVPPPGPPWRKTTGLPSRLPDTSQ